MRRFPLFASFLALAVFVPKVPAQTSNRLWFASYNGQPTPTSDVSVQDLLTAGNGAFLASGSAAVFVAQTNFASFNSPYDVAVDPAMGKVYVLDNNVQAATPEYIYSFNLAGTPPQIAASVRVIYAMPVPAADVTAGVYPLLSGLALDVSNHFLYFNQTDVTTATNSCIGRLDLATSSASDIHSTLSGNPTVHDYYAGHTPGQGPIALGKTNIYVGAINGRAGNSGLYCAPRDGSGSFSELVAVSTSDTAFTNGFAGGVADDPPDHLIYYLTFNGGDVNGNYNTNENAVWVYNDQTSNNVEIQAGYPGFPDNIAVDAANGRYYFTIGRDGTGAPTPANYQAIYDGALSSTNAPTLLYTPVLSGEDGPGQINAGNVALQGIFVEDSPVLAAPSTAIYLIGGSHIPLSPALAAADPSSTLLSGATIAVVGGSFSGDGDALSAVTNGTAITGAYVATNETLTLSGADTLANYQEVLRTVAFSSSNPDPTQAGAHPSRTISWTITDGGLAGPAVSSTLLLSTASAPATNHIAAIAVTNGWVLLFTGATNQDFVAQFAPAVTGPWTDLSPLLTPNVSGLVEYNDQITAPGPSMRFYRVRTGP